MPTSVAEIYNYRELGDDLATSGQPREDQLAAIAAAGYDVIINLALHDDPRYALVDEAASVQALGLKYIHIPVQFAAPTEGDLDQFFAAMAQNNRSRIWIHCAANKRVTAFLGLYLRLRENWTDERAFALMHDVWQPDHVWSEFIAAQLAKSNAA